MSTIFSRLLHAPKSLSLLSENARSRRTKARRGLARSSRPDKTRQQLFLEALEDRRLMASDLSITKLASIEPAIPGAPITYTIQDRNAGPDSATATVADLMPAVLNSASFSSSASGGA